MNRIFLYFGLSSEFLKVELNVSSYLKNSGSDLPETFSHTTSNVGWVNTQLSAILKISPPSSWRPVSGVENNADLPSKGCKASDLVITRFWEGPRWLSSFQDKGPSNDFKVDEDEILKERKKNAVPALVSVNQESSTEWFCQRFSKYGKVGRMDLKIYSELLFHKRKQKHKRTYGK
ncbi:hypothetical protein AVEN_244544-1 [Araneus ventricosus]|uniref:Uncharacterized protein n=1 Tax=Araneus ventricosus TaxID=182803 RepID=A0A4Y2RFZ7_ARAVE|nr:hypothetical protein AVEN_244544-1 [Araneus ventricosus]